MHPIECDGDRQHIRDDHGFFITNKTLTVCEFCGSHSPLVECAGIYHCNNLTCTGPGSAWLRSKLDSFKRAKPNGHTVEVDEWENKAKERLPSMPGYVQFWCEEV